ncbi:nucleoside hydrolase [Georgenia thermotolerans]|uniref:Nucleoside hydrolase n=1 Tax=Georgenia thermotolerans TaxID=527326 RepID=A0A7J5UTQ9_9MICO|nr:nucleoside hydrolase [Georgenia thermotolerans]KAE8765658.1 nucleoside hydrolase [Georgenia thermotolerans]
MSRRTKVIVDTDPGVGIPGTDADDPIAILLALADPRLELIGVTTTFGNCPPELGARGARAVLDAAGRPDVPVAVGSAVALNGELPGDLSSRYDGERGRAGTIPLPSLADSAISSTAAEFIVDTVNAHPHEVTLIAIGPQTNIAQALELDPGIAERLRSIVFMGGALGLDPEYGRGNVTPVAECNIWYDADAADIVFRSGVDLTMVGLDVTNPNQGVVLSASAISAIDPDASAVAGMLAQICDTYLEAPMFEWADGCVLYDPLAVAAAADPELGEYRELAVGVERDGTLTRGQTVPLRDAVPNLRVLVKVDGAAFAGNCLDRILTLGR